MRTARDVINRVTHDYELPSKAFRVGYLDRFLGIVEKRLTDLNFADDIATLSHLEAAIPQTRIMYLKYKYRVVWDRREQHQRFDDVFGSFPENNNTTIRDIVAADPYGEEDEARDDAQEQEAREGDQQEALRHAAQREQLQQREAADRPNFFVCCRILGGKTKRLIQAIQDADPTLQQGRIDIERLHVTLLTLRLRNELEVERAKEALQQFDLESVVHPDKPLRLKGFSSFRGRVLYVCVDDETDSYTTICTLHECLRNHMIARLGIQSWKGQSHERFTPHITVSKLSRAMTRQGQFINEIMFARHKNVELGSFRVRGLHLCVMQAPQLEHHFYEVKGSVFSTSKSLVFENPALGHLARRDLEHPRAQDGGLRPELDAIRVTQRLREMAHVVEDPVAMIVAFRGLGAAAKRRAVDALVQETAGVVVKDAAQLRELPSWLANPGFVRGSVVVVDAPLAQRWELDGLALLAHVCNCQLEIRRFVEHDFTEPSVACSPKSMRFLRNLEEDPRETIERVQGTALLEGSTRLGLAEGDREQLHVFDLDRTLLNTAERPSNHAHRNMFFALPESLDPALDDQVTEGPAFERFQELDRSECAVVVLTARSEGLRTEVERILQAKGCFRYDGLHMHPPGKSTGAAFKCDTMQQLVSCRKYQKVVFYDDDTETLRNMEDTLANHCSGVRFQVVDAKSMHRRQANQGTTVFERCRETLVHRAAALTSSSPDEVLCVTFGSQVYGKVSCDFDVCVVVPAQENAEPPSMLKALYSSDVERGSFFAQGIKVKDSHFAMRAICPRISMLLEDVHTGKEIEIDVVAAQVNVQQFQQLKDEITTRGGLPTSRTLQSCMDHSDCVETRNSLSGVYFAAKLVEALAEHGASLEAFRYLQHRAVELLECAGLRGRHFQMIRTFQLAMILEKFFASRPANTRWRSFCKFVGSELAEEEWTDLIRGVRDVAYAECNLIFAPRMRELFRAAACGKEDSFRMFTTGYLHCVLSVTSSRPWKTTILLNAGLPRVIRTLIKEAGDVVPKGTGQVHWLASGKQWRAKIEIRLPATSTASADLIHQNLVLRPEDKLDVDLF
ncbi:Leukocyte receptor cluster member 9 [Durusdinium trenchii]|uniref:Leukocyte receptor cluster member 9 n=1 Tax=Durusdinium trenchii TaxID=1381693 RepID=A0ABP0RU56_9DINO